MKQRELTNRLLSFIEKTPNTYWCAYRMAEQLKEAGFIELYENEPWQLNSSQGYYVRRNDASIIAFRTTAKSANRFLITAAHGDSPSFHLKSNAVKLENGYLKLNTELYGGMIYASWMDRPLSIAGRVVVAHQNRYETILVNIDKDLLVIPNQAIHLNREINDGYKLNPQKDLLPMMALSEDKELLNNILTDMVKEEILESDLYLYVRDVPRYYGANEEFILSPRLDDLGCAYGALEGFLAASKSDAVQVLAVFNREEIGSLSIDGADSTFMNDVLSRIAEANHMDLNCALRNSLLVSADNGHALHPNAPEKSDMTNPVYLNRGIVIKHHQNYTTDALTSAMFKGILRKADVPYQDFACRSDLRCGATLGGISLSHVSVPSVDIGLPQLAMHSANETCGSDDFVWMVEGLKAFYQSDMQFAANAEKGTL